MKIAAIIPARYASTRFPGKPLAILLNKPVIQWVYEGVKKSRLVDEVFVATDDKRIQTAVEEFGGRAIMTSEEHKTGSERVAEAARLLPADIKIIVNVQGDEPLIHPEMISQLVVAMADNARIAVATLKYPIGSWDELWDANAVKVITDISDCAIYFSRFPVPYSKKLWEAQKAGLSLSKEEWEGYFWRHIGIYAFRRYALSQFSEFGPSGLERKEQLEQLRLLEHGYKIKVVSTNYNTFGVDTVQDLKKVSDILERRTIKGVR